MQKKNDECQADLLQCLQLVFNYPAKELDRNVNQILGFLISDLKHTKINKWVLLQTLDHIALAVLDDKRQPFLKDHIKIHVHFNLQKDVIAVVEDFSNEKTELKMQQFAKKTLDDWKLIYLNDDLEREISAPTSKKQG